MRQKYRYRHKTTYESTVPSGGSPLSVVAFNFKSQGLSKGPRSHGPSLEEWVSV